MLTDALKAALRAAALDPENQLKWDAVGFHAQDQYATREAMEGDTVEAIAFIVGILRDNQPGWLSSLGKGAIVGAAAGGVAVLTAPYWLPAIGFGAAGVAVGSIAAGVQTAATASGSVFAVCQSVGAAGTASAWFGTFATGLGVGGAGAGAAGAGLGGAWDWARNGNEAREQQLQQIAAGLWHRAIESAFGA